MRPAQSLVSLVLALASLANPAAGFDDPAGGMHGLVARADGSPTSTPPPESKASSSASSAKSDASPASTATSGPKPTGTTADLNTAEPSESGKPKPKPTGSATATSDDEEKPSHTGFPPDAPPGGVNMLTPVPNLEATPLYKIRDQVTWGWNYTGLLATPTAIDVMVSCSFASETWTLTSNMSFATSVNYVWDTNKQADSVEKPLLTQMYTLIVKDSDTDINAPPEPGYLGVSKGFFRFGLYAAQPYTPYPDWTCTGCSGAAALLSSQALGLAVTMSAVTLLSFTWFVSGLDLR